MFSILLQTARGILNSLICAVYFSNHFNSVSLKKGSGNLLVLYQDSMPKKKKRLDKLVKSLHNFDTSVFLTVKENKD